MAVYYINGDFVPAEDATVPAGDLAVIRGYGVFDFTRTYGGKPFRLNEHLERLENSAALIDMPLPWSRDELAQIILETLSRNPYAECSVRIVVTGGVSSNFITPTGDPTLMVMVAPAKPYPDWWYANGVKVMTTVTERGFPTAKTINYIPAIMALKRAHAINAVEAIYVSTDGYVLEGTTSNIFAFIGDELVTPEAQILVGITREVVREIVQDVYPVVQRPITREEIYAADEVFITASNKEVVPVIRVDDADIADGKPGERTRHILHIYREFTRSFAQA